MHVVVPDALSPNNPLHPALCTYAGRAEDSEPSVVLSRLIISPSGHEKGTPWALRNATIRMRTERGSCARYDTLLSTPLNAKARS